VLATDIAWAWVRAGDTEKARAMMGDALADDSTGVRGWLAVYEGDIATARKALRESGTPSSDAVRAQAIIARTRAERAPQLGAAFLALARRDSVRAATLFESATAELPDAAPLLLATAAEIRHARGDVTGAIALWQRVVDKYGDSPDAPRAELALARALLASGDRAGAKAHAEHLILTWQSSALVPQARRLLDTLGGAE
jgi:tetratricopeptide (TPR) repeat protein